MKVFYNHKKNYHDKFPITIEGLAGDTTQDTVRDFCGNAVVVSLSPPSYTEPPLGHMETFLGRFGKVEIDVVQNDRSKPRGLAFAHFVNGESAANAAANSGAKHSWLGNTPLKIELVHCIRLSLPIPGAMPVLGMDLNRLRQAHRDVCRIYQHQDSDSSPICIRVSGKDAAELAIVQREVTAVVHGEILDANGEPVWDDWFGSEKGVEFFKGHNEKYQRSHIACDFRTPTIRLFGDADARANARKNFNKTLKTLQERRHTVPFEDGVLNALFSGAMTALHRPDGISNASSRLLIDFRARQLVVRGDDQVLNAVKKRIEEYRSGELFEQACCLCARTPQATSIALRCGHLYCKECLRSYLQALSRTDVHQVSCFMCEGTISFAMLQVLLVARGELDNLFEYIFLHHIRTHPDEFRFCPTPQCPVVYRPGEEGDSIRCPSCTTLVCISCHTVHHNDRTCEQYRQELVDPQIIRDVIETIQFLFQ